MSQKFYVVKKSAGYACKAMSNESEAREFAAACCRANWSNNYIVCVYSEGVFQQI